MRNVQELLRLIGQWKVISLVIRLSRTTHRRLCWNFIPFPAANRTQCASTTELSGDETSGNCECAVRDSYSLILRLPLLPATLAGLLIWRSQLVPLECIRENRSFHLMRCE